MSQYETMVLVAPTLAPEAVDRLLHGYEEVITTHGGQVNNVDKWGRRTLAFEIQKYKEGIYAVYDYTAPGDFVKEFERRLRLNDSVLRFLTVKTDRRDRLEQKGTAQRQAKQEKMKRRTSRPASAPSPNIDREER
jgi:small subunit ribosomal protein S6